MTNLPNINVANANRQYLIELKSAVTQIKEDIKSVLDYNKRIYQKKFNGQEHQVEKPNTFSFLFKASINRLNQYQVEIDKDCDLIIQFCNTHMANGALSEQGKIRIEDINSIQGSIANLYKFILDEVASLEKIEKQDERELDDDVKLSEKLNNLQMSLNEDLYDKFEKAKKEVLSKFVDYQDLEKKYTILFEVKRQLEGYKKSTPATFDILKTRVNFLALINQASTLTLENVPEDVSRYLASLQTP